MQTRWRSRCRNFKLKVADTVNPNPVAGCRFVRDEDPGLKAGTEDGRQKLRSLAERALSAGGLHVAEGARLWNLYRCAACLGLGLGFRSGRPARGRGRQAVEPLQVCCVAGSGFRV